MTKEGADPLLDAEENCSDLVEPPNELEVSHAFTRRMTHLLCVMRAISNFKALLSSRSRLNSPRLNLAPSDAAAPQQPRIRPHHKPKPSMDEQELSDFKRQNEQHALQLLKERMHVLKSRATGSLSLPNSLKDTEGSERSSSSETRREHVVAPLQTAPPVLGIGTGGVGEWPPNYTHANPPSVVADSPSAVDFNVYDRAYEDEIERIKQNGGRPSVYMTWHLGEKGRVRSEEGDNLELLEDRHGEEQEDGDSGKGKLKSLFKPNRFADLVSQTIKDTKEAAIGKDHGS